MNSQPRLKCVSSGWDTSASVYLSAGSMITHREVNQPKPNSHSHSQWKARITLGSGDLQLETNEWGSTLKT